jgi:hypothetical protein
MACASCSAGALFTLLTVCSVGLTTGAVVALYVWLTINHVQNISSGVNIGFIVAIVVSVAFLCFAVYASCCGRRCARGLLGLCFLLYTAAFGALALGVALDDRDARWVIDHGRRFWDSKADFPHVAENIEAAFGCCGWDTACQQKRGCHQAITDWYEDNKWVIFGAVTGIAVLMLVGVVCAFVSACRKEKPQGIAYAYMESFQ